MPFTPTHVLTIVPVAALSRRALPISGQVIGSMIPDFPLFVPIAPEYSTTHSPLGMLTACLPLGIWCFVVFQYVMKRPILALLPAETRRRFGSVATPIPLTSIRALAGVLMALAVGATTHLIWDAFTHQGRWGTRLIPWLGSDVLSIAGVPISGAKVFQYGSSLVAFPILTWLLFDWLRRQPPCSTDDLLGISVGVRVAVFLTMLVGPTAVALAVWCWGQGTAYSRFGRSITSSGLLIAIALLAYSIVFQNYVRRRNYRPS